MGPPGRPDPSPSAPGYDPRSHVAERLHFDRFTLDTGTRELLADGGSRPPLAQGLRPPRDPRPEAPRGRSAGRAREADLALDPRLGDEPGRPGRGAAQGPRRPGPAGPLRADGAQLRLRVLRDRVRACAPPAPPPGSRGRLPPDHRPPRDRPRARGEPARPGGGRGGLAGLGVGLAPPCAHRRSPGESATLEDLGSRNGTRLRDREVKGPVPLADGDAIELGSVIMTFRVVPAGETEDAP